MGQGRLASRQHSSTRLSLLCTCTGPRMQGGGEARSTFKVFKQGRQAQSTTTSSWRPSISGGEAEVRVGLASKDYQAPWPAFGLALAPPSVRSARARACSYGRSHAPAQVSRPVTYHTACNSLNHALLWHDKLRCEGRTPFPALSPSVCRRPLCCGRCSPGFRVPSRVRRRGAMRSVALTHLIYRVIPSQAVAICLEFVASADQAHRVHRDSRDQVGRGHCD